MIDIVVSVLVSFSFIYPLGKRVRQLSAECEELRDDVHRLKMKKGMWNAADAAASALTKHARQEGLIK